MSARRLRDLLKGPRDGWPPEWPHWPVTAQAHRLAFQDCVAAVPDYPGGHKGRGVVVCSGGWRFLPSLYVTVRVLRQVGCALPVEVWYLGEREFDPCFAACLDGLGITWVDALTFCREYGLRRRCLGGWELKPLAVQHSRFREVLYLDADCYPVVDPTPLFEHPAYREAGAVFWPDNPDDPCGRLEPGQWQRWGLAWRDEPSFESGQMLVDKARCWRALEACNWLNDHSDYTYVHQYGDKDTFHLAWRATDTPYAMAPRVRWHEVAFVHHDLEGRPLFVHRCRDKFRLPELGPLSYCTAQWGPTNVFCGGLLQEEFAHRALTELRGLLFPERLPAWRPGTDDVDTWREVTLLNVYRLPTSFVPGDVIVDVGAHIGVFSTLCLQRGAGRVYAAEPYPPNLELLRRNLAPFGSRAVVRGVAVWGKSGPGTLAFHPPSAPGRTNNGRCREVPPGAEGEVPTVSLDDLLREASGGGARRVRLLKLDCEGAEFPALKSAGLLTLVDEIVGEYHEFDPPDNTPTLLARLLEDCGFAVELRPNPGDPEVGLFLAHKLGEDQ